MRERQHQSLSSELLAGLPRVDVDDLIASVSMPSRFERDMCAPHAARPGVDGETQR